MSINLTFLNSVSSEAFHSILTLLTSVLSFFRLVALGLERSQRVCLDERRGSKWDHGRSVQRWAEEETRWDVDVGWK